MPLYDKVAGSDVMRRAWREVRVNRGAPGVDGVSIDDVERLGVDEFLDQLAERLRAGTYRSRPLRRVHIPKPGKPGQLRPLGIPCVADRVVTAAAKIVLEPIFEADFLPSSYGFRLGRSAHHALETIRQTVTWRGKSWVLDADIGSCFDEIDHDALLAQIGRRVCDRRMLKLLGGWLRAGVFEGGIVSATEAGTPQGSPESLSLPEVPRALSFWGSSMDARVLEAAGSVVSAEVAVTTGDGLCQSQDSRPYRPPLRRAAVGMGCGGPQPRAARLGQLLPLRKLRTEVLPDRCLRQRTPRALRQRQGRTQRPQLGHPLHV
jgi:hypothetical protein